jgi:hypothetical protein
MPARKNRGLGELDNHWKQKIQKSVLVTRLHDNALGKIEMSRGQIESAKILLRKVAPDLTTVAVGQEETLGPVQITWKSKP